MQIFIYNYCIIFVIKVSVSMLNKVLFVVFIAVEFCMVPNWAAGIRDVTGLVLRPIII